MTENETIEESADTLLDRALSLATRAYRTHVEEIAEDFREDMRRGEITTDEQLSDRMHEAIDGDGWVIYTRKAQLVCIISQNDDAYFTELGGEGAADRDGINWSPIAFMALRADVQEALDVSDVEEFRRDYFAEKVGDLTPTQLESLSGPDFDGESDDRADHVVERLVSGEVTLP